MSFFLSPELWSWPPVLRVPYLQGSSSRSNVSPRPRRPGSCMAEGSSCWQYKLHNLRGTSRGFGQRQGRREIYSLPLPHSNELSGLQAGQKNTVTAASLHSETCFQKCAQASFSSLAPVQRVSVFTSWLRTLLETWVSFYYVSFFLLY